MIRYRISLKAQDDRTSRTGVGKLFVLLKLRDRVSLKAQDDKTSRTSFGKLFVLPKILKPSLITLGSGGCAVRVVMVAWSSRLLGCKAAWLQCSYCYCSRCGSSVFAGVLLVFCVLFGAPFRGLFGSLLGTFWGIAYFFD